MGLRKPRKRGVKPGTKRGRYKKLNDLAEIDTVRVKLKSMIQLKIKYLQQLLKGL